MVFPRKCFFHVILGVWVALCYYVARSVAIGLTEKAWHKYLL